MKIIPTITAAFIFALIAVSASAQMSQPAVLSATGGRYIFGQISSMRADQFMLDTQTGRLWQLVVDTNGAALLQAVPYKSVDGPLTLVPRNPQEEIQGAVQAAKSQLPDAQKQPEPTTK